MHHAPHPPTSRGRLSYAAGLEGSDLRAFRLRPCTALLLVATMATSGCGHWREHQLRELKDESIVDARRQLLSDGWVPRDQDRANCDFDAGSCPSLDPGLARLGIHEMDACTGAGPQFCNFYYTRGDRCLFVQTAGEHRPEEGATADVWRLIEGACVSCPECSPKDHIP